MATSKAIFFAADAADQAFEVLRQALQAHEQNGCAGELSPIQCTLGKILVCRSSRFPIPPTDALSFVFAKVVPRICDGGQHPNQKPLYHLPEPRVFSAVYLYVDVPAGLHGPVASSQAVPIGATRGPGDATGPLAAAGTRLGALTYGLTRLTVIPACRLNGVAPPSAGRAARVRARGPRPRGAPGARARRAGRGRGRHRAPAGGPQGRRGRLTLC